MNNIFFTWGDVFNQSLQSLWYAFVQFTPKLILAIILFIIGWLLGNIIARAIEQVFSALKIDKLFSSVGAEGFLHRAGLKLDTGYFVGQIVKWFVVIIFLLPSLSLVLGPDNAVESFLKVDVLGYLPNVIIAVLVLIIGAVVSEGVFGVVVAATKSANLKHANLFGSVAKYAIWVFAFIIALGKLGLGDYMSILFSGIIGMLAVAGALAFGLGGKDAAARFINKLGEEVSHN